MSTRESRGAAGSGNIRQRSDGRWEGRYTVGIDPGTGKQVQKSIYGKTQKEVRERLRKITSEIDDGSYLEPSRCRVGQWLDRKHFIAFQSNRAIRAIIPVPPCSFSP